MNRIIKFSLLLFSMIYSENLIYTVKIDGAIDMGLPYFLERVTEDAETAGAAYIIYEIDTFGGRVDAATKIKDAILSSRIPTVAFINRRAISAGALISLSCDSIFMTSGATIGAATAVDASGKKTSEKVISYMREEMASTAEATGRSREIAAAMVDDELEIEYQVTISGDTLTANQINGFKEYKLITLSTEYAVLLGIADYEIETFSEVLLYLGMKDAKVIDKTPSWSENLVRFLTHPAVAPMLMSLGFLGIMFELKSPGFGFPGAFGLLCIALFFGSHLLVGLADISEILILGTGILLIMLEIFVIPGFGIAGIGGTLLLLWGFFQMLIGKYPTPDDYNTAYWGLNIGIVTGIIGLILAFQFLTRSKIFQKIVPVKIQKKDEGYSVSKGFENLIGKSGIAETDLRPSGKIEIDGAQYHARSRGDFISSGTDVTVNSVEENELIVQKNSEDDNISS